MNPNACPMNPDGCLIHSFNTLRSLKAYYSIYMTGQRSAVGNVSGNRCESDCWSRGREFDPGPVPYFVEIDHEIISRVSLLPSDESFKKGFCQLQAKVCAQSTG